jgi:alkylation response protein AidB-like acyl-CoA dehydrogenase
MYDYTLTEEQQAFKDSVRKFAEKELMPLVAKADAMEDPKECWDLIAPVARKSLQAGHGKLCIPEEYGGTGAGLIEFMILCEEIGYVDSGFALSAMVTACAPRLLLNSPVEQKEKWLRPTGEDETGKYIWAFVSTEPYGGNEMICPLPDPKLGIHMTAVRDGKGYRIKGGTKVFITNGGVAEVYMLNCRTRPDRSNVNGCNWLMFTKDTPGYSIGKYEHKIGWRTSTNTTIYIDDMWIPEEDRVGPEGEGFWVIENILLENAVGIAAISLGTMRAAYNLALAHCKERVTWGKPIIEHQAVSSKLVNMRMKIESCRALTEKLAWAAMNPKLAQDGLGKLTKLAKFHSAMMVQEVTNDAAYLFGGYGLMRGHPVEKLLRDGLPNRVVEGSIEANQWTMANYDLDLI